MSPVQLRAHRDTRQTGNGQTSSLPRVPDLGHSPRLRLSFSSSPCSPKLLHYHSPLSNYTSSHSPPSPSSSHYLSSASSSSTPSSRTPRSISSSSPPPGAGARRTTRPCRALRGRGSRRQWRRGWCGRKGGMGWGRSRRSWRRLRRIIGLHRARWDDEISDESAAMSKAYDVARASST